MHAFCRNAIYFELLYGSFLASNVQKLYKQKFSCISFRLKGYVCFERYGHSVPCLSGQFSIERPKSFIIL